jgi:NhaA family Na+:H+ antiporter
MSDVFKRFLKLESASGIILILAALLAIGLANSALAQHYQSFLNTEVQVRIAALDINKPLLLWINDGFMAIFFLLVGLEVKREMLEGALSSRVQATFPAIAAVGGMLAPALIYSFFNYGDEVPCWLGDSGRNRHRLRSRGHGAAGQAGTDQPQGLLLALAIMDDLGVIIIIALFYTQQLSLTALAIGVVATLTLLWMNRRGEDRIGLYMLVGLVLWVAVLKSGVHATLAGVIVGFMIPSTASVTHRHSSIWSMCCTPECLPDPAAVRFRQRRGIAGGITGSAQSGAHGDHPGALRRQAARDFHHQLAGCEIRHCPIAARSELQQIFAVSILCGIGFTMSMFIASLAFEHGGLDYGSYSRLGILAGSTLAAVIGYIALRISLPNREANQSTEGL